MKMPLPLAELLADVDARVNAIRADRPGWLCAKGCDGCCRRLAAVPRLTAAEWALLHDALAALAAPRLDEIRQKMAALAEDQRSFPIVCPLLDAARGAWPVDGVVVAPHHVGQGAAGDAQLDLAAIEPKLALHVKAIGTARHRTCGIDRTGTARRIEQRTDDGKER